MMRLLDTQTAAVMLNDYQLSDEKGVIRVIDHRKSGYYTIRYIDPLLDDTQASPFVYRNYKLVPLPTKSVDCNYTLGK